MTTAALLIALAALLLGVASVVALLELHYRVQTLSSMAGIADEQRAVRIEALGQRPSTFGFPEGMDDGSGIILILSTKCSTCVQLAQSLAGVVPRNLYLVVGAPTEALSREWVESHRLESDRTFLDAEYIISESLGANVTPIACSLVDGFITSAVSVPSMESLTHMLRGLPTREETR